MADKKLLRKIAPIIMSAAVAMTSSPVGVIAEDFTSEKQLLRYLRRLHMVLMRFQTTMTNHQRLTIQQILVQTQRMVLNLEKPQKRSLDLRTAKPETQKMLF